MRSDTEIKDFADAKSFEKGAYTGLQPTVDELTGRLSCLQPQNMIECEKI